MTRSASTYVEMILGGVPPAEVALLIAEGRATNVAKTIGKNFLWGVKVTAGTFAAGLVAGPLGVAVKAGMTASRLIDGYKDGVASAKAGKSLGDTLTAGKTTSLDFTTAIGHYVQKNRGGADKKSSKEILKDISNPPKDLDSYAKKEGYKQGSLTKNVKAAAKKEAPTIAAKKKDADGGAKDRRTVFGKKCVSVGGKVVFGRCVKGGKVIARSKRGR